MFSLVTRELFHKYRAIIIAVLIFLACDLGVMGTNFYSSFKISESAVSINLSGRQRMLSQRTTKVLLSLQDHELHGTSQEADLKELAMVVSLFDTTLKGFRDGGSVTGGDGHPVFLAQVETEEADRIVRDAYGIWTPYLEKLHPLLNAPGFTKAQLQAATDYARANNLKLLGLMNDLTTDLENVANRRAERLRLIQVLGLVAALINVLYTVFKSVSDLIRSDRELAKAQKETEEILGTVKEGLFLLDGEYRLGAQYSKSLDDVLQREISPNMPFLPLLEAMVPKKVFGDAKDYIELLLGDRVKEALVASLNPLNEVEVRDKEGKKIRYLSFHFNRVFENEKISHLLVTVQDVTNLVRLNEELEAAKGQTRVEVEVLLKLLNTDTSVLQQFLDNVAKALAQINERLRSDNNDAKSRMLLVNYILRLVHGIKGEAAALGVEIFEGYAHDFEKELIEMRELGIVSGEDMVRITVLLDGFYERLASISGVVERIMTGSDGSGNDKYMQTITSSLNNLVARIAKDSRKEVKLRSNIGDLEKLPRHITAELYGLATQLLRNAVKHGIEEPSERVAQGKNPQGEIYIECREADNGQYEFTVRDDGRGISLDRIRGCLVNNGRVSEDEANALDTKAVVRYLFETGFSTSQDTDRDAGHGIGLDVVARKIHTLSGRLSLSSRMRSFTEFKVRFAL